MDRKPINRKDSVTKRRFETTVFCVRASAAFWLAVVVFSCTGCRSLRPSDGEGIFSAASSFSTDSIRGPLERAFYNEEDALTRGEKFSEEALRNVDKARKQFDDGQYAAAIKTYKQIAKKYPETSIGEEAWFRMGESHYALKQYPDAQEAYDKLFKDYPSTKYVSDASERLFEIARIWLRVSGPAAQSAIKTVSAKTGQPAPEPKKSLSPSERYGLIPNFFDKTRPVFDTGGRARMALKSIWLNDPTGPLADDALMLTAAYYLQSGNHLEADTYFDILRSDYADSPHLEDAFVLGSHVKQMAYQGPHYDGTTLIAAEDLKQKTLNLFPNSKDRQQVREDLNRIYLLKAQRKWSDVEFWKRKDNPVSVAIVCQQVITDFPDTRYAELARKEIRSIDRKLIQHLPEMAQFLDSLESSQVGGSANRQPPRLSETPADDGIPGI